MARSQGGNPNAYVRVGLKALRDSAFFAHLLDDPEGALTPTVRQELGLTDADVARIVAQIRKIKTSHVTKQQLLDAATLFRTSMLVERGDWPDPTE